MSIFLIWSNEHCAWWRANGAGYTSDVWTAGRYSEEEANNRCSSTSVKDVAVPAPEDYEHTRFTVAAIRAAQDDMQRRIKEATEKAIAARSAVSA